MESVISYNGVFEVVYLMPVLIQTRRCVQNKIKQTSSGKQMNKSINKMELPYFLE